MRDNGWVAVWIVWCEGTMEQLRAATGWYCLKESIAEDGVKSKRAVFSFSQNGNWKLTAEWCYTVEQTLMMFYSGETRMRSMRSPC
jgi:hypothetical protein